MLDLIGDAGMMPHGYCLLWKPWLVALHAVADAVIFVSYFVIPLAILRFLRARPDIRFGSIGWLFAAFILLCGLTHLVGLVTLWYPVYELQGVVKIMTALVSATTAAVIFPLVPKLVALPSPAQLQSAIADLEGEVQAHRRTLAELGRIRASLEAEVVERTRELQDTNERLTLVTRETVHRSKNLLTVVQSIARQTAAATDSKEEMLEALAGRMSSIAGALSTVLESDSRGAELADVVATQIDHYRDSFPDRIAVDGPSLRIRAEAAQQLGLAVHELATNAVKHGALSGPGGQISIRWAPIPAAGGVGERVRFTWQESGFHRPRTAGAEGRQGFGSILLKRAVPIQLRAEMRAEFTADGYLYELVVPLSELAARSRIQSAEEVEQAFR